MDHRHYSPAGLSESELDESSSTASSPMSISSAEASSPYDSSRLNGDEDPTDSSFSTSVNSPSISSPPPSPAESTQSSSTTTSCSTSNSNTTNNNYQWSNNNPYYNGSKSVRWFRDDRGLWSERSSNRRSSNSPYHRNTPSSNKQQHHLENTSNSHKEVSEVLIDAVQREDQAQLRHLLAKSAAHVNILGQEGDSPLHRSCRQGNLDTVKLLVSLFFSFSLFK